MDKTLIIKRIYLFLINHKKCLFNKYQNFCNQHEIFVKFTKVCKIVYNCIYKV